MLKDQRPSFNPRDDPEDNGNYPYNATEAYEAAMRGEPVYHCPSCDAYLDKPICLGHAIQYTEEGEYAPGFRQPANAHLKPTAHAYMQNGRLGGHEYTIPLWEMSARERYGVGYHPVPDPAEEASEGEEGILDMMQGMVGSLNAWRNLPEGEQPHLRDWFAQQRMEEARQNRMLYIAWMMDKFGLEADEMKGLLTNPGTHPDPQVRRHEQQMADSYTEGVGGTDDYMTGIWEMLGLGQNEEDDEV